MTNTSNNELLHALKLQRRISIGMFLFALMSFIFGLTIGMFLFALMSFVIGLTLGVLLWLN